MVAPGGSTWSAPWGDAVDAGVTHRAKRTPALAQKYRKVLKVTAARNAKIAAGIESAKAARKPA